VVICLERGADLHMAQLMPLPLTVSCFSRIQIGFTFLVPAHPGSPQWRIAKNGGGYTQTGVAKGLKVPCLFITEVSIRCQKNPEVGVRRIPAYTPNTPLVVLDKEPLNGCVCVLFTLVRI